MKNEFNTPSPLLEVSPANLFGSASDEVAVITAMSPSDGDSPDEDDEGWSDIDDEDFEDIAEDNDDVHEMELDNDIYDPDDDDHLPDDDF